MFHCIAIKNMFVCQKQHVLPLIQLEVCLVEVEVCLVEVVLRVIASYLTCRRMS